MKVLSVLLVLFIVNRCHSIENRDLYDVVVQGSVTLPRGNEESVHVNLQTPIKFYTDRYDSIHINTNGILTFLNEFPEFLNIPFPIEYPSISPFYSNIDTTDADAASKISYYQTTDGNLLNRASNVIREAFSDAREFQAKALFVVTWNNVPKWRGESRERLYEKNTFQVAVTSSDDESYVEFLYPQGGIQWVKAESGESGLPDIRARAGFVASDGRYVGLKGSGTDRVRHLSETSNYGEPGRWLYRVGKLEEGENVEEPDNVSEDEETAQPLTCASGGRLQCHSAATCEDTADGFCCKCKDGFYGNGNSCIMNSIPIRVTGHINGRIGASTISSQLQSYIVMVDGRSYTAVSALSNDLGLKVQLLEIIGGVIGWLFAKPVGATLNGYQITGGKFNHTSSIRFKSGENFQITQRYTGLNLWDQLAAEIEVSGDVPSVHEGIKLTMEDFVDEYTTSGPNTIQSVSSHTIQLSAGQPAIGFTIQQTIKYESCAFVEQAQRDNNINGRLKTSKVQLGFFAQEKAVRISTISKVGLTDRSNPCFEGTANCGDNTICVPGQDEAYECQCKNGFTFASLGDSESTEICVDIDECSNAHICSEFAQCHNRNGGYECVCQSGYEGNGYECRRMDDRIISRVDDRPSPRPRPERPQPQDTTAAYDQCRDCSENAYCQDGNCICRNGFSGNGHDCRMICALNEVFNGVSCVKPVTVEEDEITPYCTPSGCVCPRGYQMIEYSFKAVCRYDDSEGSTNAPTSCDVYDNCNRDHGHCEYDQTVGRFECVCDPGFDGNGIECNEVDTNCQSNPHYCDPYADCVYNSTTRENSCVCQRGYEGNGRTCARYVECETAVDCGLRSVCRYGTCECEDGYEKDSHEFCVQSGLCNGAFCAENAHCLFDERSQVNYCHCPDGFIGDGVLECKSIPPPCNIRNNCGLFATCSPNYRTQSYECTCNDGYSGDGFVCLLESNCHNIPELCDRNANCTSTSNGWKCICNQGFVGNGSICNPPPRLESGFLLISQGVAVVKVPLTGRKKGVPVSTASMAIGIDKDCAEGRVYWSDISAKAILTSKYDGTDKKTFIDTDIISPEGVAVDWVSRRIYWTDSGKDTVEVASLENSTIRSVLINRGLVNPRGIAIDPHQNKIFWSDWNRHNPKIEWANLDGSDRETLVSAPAVKLPNSLALSMSTGEICYADAGNFKIECIDTYSKQPRVIADNLNYPFGLAITDEHFYWSDWNTTKIESIDFNGVRQTGIQTTHFRNYKMYGMASVVDRCPVYFSACNINNGDCPHDHICLVNPRLPSGRSCKCLTQGNCNINDVDSELGAHYA